MTFSNSEDMQVGHSVLEPAALNPNTPIVRGVPAGFVLVPSGRMVGVAREGQTRAFVGDSGIYDFTLGPLSNGSYICISQPYTLKGEYLVTHVTGTKIKLTSANKAIRVRWNPSIRIRWAQIVGNILWVQAAQDSTTKRLVLQKYKIIRD